LSGTSKPFVDDKVYSKNRQFRTVLSWKLDDDTTTGLQIRGLENDTRLLQSMAVTAGKVTASAGQQSQYGPPPCVPAPKGLDSLMPWQPGIRVHYMRPRGGPTRASEKGFPVWEVPGQHP